jgi:drug/metabolite transporter (DMT)-like permease
MKRYSINGIPIIFWGLLFLLGLIWGSSFYAVSISLDSFEPMQISSTRILIGALVLTFLSFKFGEGLPSFSKGKRKVWLYSFGMGAFTNAIPFSLLSWAQTEVSSSFAGLAMSFVPFITLTLAHYLVINERLTVLKVCGLTVGFLGMLVLFDVYKLYIHWTGSEHLQSKLACFGAAACYSIGSIITRRSPLVSKLAFSSSGLIAASLIIVPLTLYTDGFPQVVELKAFLPLVYLGLLPTGVATVLLVYLIKSVGPTFLSLVNYLVPIWAIIFGIFLNSEILKPSFVLALGLIFSGMILSQLGAKKDFKITNES